jgi:glutathione synthase/RimK-type ligase-like ATP-grasp enzyme
MKTVVINWGSSAAPQWPYVVNKQAGEASNKLIAFQQMADAEVQTVPWTTKRLEAHDWIDRGERVFARKLLSSHSGRGIENLKAEKGKPWILDEVPEAPLYTKYIQKSAEYRVHIVGNEVLVQQKKQRHDAVVKDKFIRSWHNGWVFCKNDIVIPEGIVDLARRAVLCLGLSFGAVDIIQGKKDGELYVLEVNTAPGLDNGTVETYVNGFSFLRGI